MLPAPRVVVVDDDPRHLRGLADGLNRYGTACLQIHFNGDVSSVKACPQVRVIFADLHLSEGAVGGDHARHFAVIGGLIQEIIAPAGPYIVVLWTKFADQAGALNDFLAERLVDVPKPFAVVPLDKMTHLNPDGAVKDAEALVAAITEIVASQPQIGALLDWEERVLGAAAGTVNAILGIAQEGADNDLAQRLSRLLFHLAEGAVGEDHVESDRFKAVNEALLPILADRVGALRGRENNDPWRGAFDDEDTRSALSLDDAALLNRFSHLADCAANGGDDRGAVIELPTEMRANFEATFDLTEAITAARQFGCKDFAPEDAKFRWLLIQVQAVCDHAQRQPGPLPYLLALEMPVASMERQTPQAVWTSPALRIDNNQKVIRASARFSITLSRANARAARSVFRVREQLLSELVYQAHVYGARPGNIAFREKKQKPKPAPA